MRPFTIRPQRTHGFLLFAAVVLACSAGAAAQDLPPIDSTTGAPNPYRGKASVIAAGKVAYQAHCATCHGDEASRAVAEAPDLRRLNLFCLRLKDDALQQHCLKDVDTYFLHSVREGKVRAGVIHMPPWKDQLTPQEIWAIRTFVESRPLDPPRRTTSVDAARAAASAVKR